MKIYFNVSGLVIVAAMVLSGCSDEHEMASSVEVLRPVRTITIESLNEGLTRGFPGVVDASQKADLAFRVSGNLIEIPVREGDEIIEGQIIASLDKTDFKLRVKTAKSDYEAALADFNRAKALIKKSHISRSDFDKLKSKYTTAKSQLASANLDLSYTEIKAPFSGIIGKRYIEKFEEISAKEPVVELQDLSTLLVRIDVPETFMIRAKKSKNPAGIYAIFEEFSDKKYPLKLSEVSTRADENTQTYRVSFSMDNPAGKTILPGMSVLVRGKRKDTLKTDNIYYVPTHAVIEDNQGRFVYIVESASSGVGVIKRVSVNIGDLTDQGIAIKSGLESGNRVVTAGVSKVKDGMRVRLISGSNP